MHLKRLVVSGFKSFADKVTLNFDRGITGIVGPNGSGKSNVIDSVRWVMGEQNAKYLRGQVATDIIFAGSDKRKALGMAEVTLVFDNSDASAFCPPEYRHEPEISLSRRLYVDGQREYFINKKPCRLKDIVGFFATTGLGGRSYSMIQQGQVDRVLNAKPEDVREILEEAAGTLVFKARRQAAAKKLETTGENLKRIEDIIAELAKQLTTLENQVEKARTWKQLSTDLREKELGLFAHNYVKLQETFTKLTQENDAEIDREVEFMGQVAHWEARVEELQGILSESDPELDEIREQVSSIREQIVRKESSITSAMAIIDQGQKRLREIDTELEESSDNLRALEEQVAAATERLDAAQGDRERLQDELAALQEEVDRVGESEQVFESRVSEMEDEQRRLDHLLQSNALRCEAIERDRKRVSQDMARYQERIETLQHEMAAVNKGLEVAQEKVRQYQDGLETEVSLKQTKENLLEEVLSEISSFEEKRDALKERYFSARARLGSLQEIESSTNDIHDVEAKLLDAGAGSDLLGVLSDRLELNAHASNVVKPVLAAFDRWAERLLVDAYSGLNNVLKTSANIDLGGFQVSVLSSAEHFDAAEVRAWAEQYGAKAASSFIDVKGGDTRIAGLVNRLYCLERDELSEGVLESLPRGIVVFTSSGVCFADTSDFKVGRLTGQGSLSRRAEIETLAAELTTTEADMETIQLQLMELEEAEQKARAELKELDTLLQSKNKDLFKVMSELQSIAQQHSHKQELLNDARQQSAQCEEQGRLFIKEIEDLGKSRLSIGQEKDRLEDEIETLRSDSSSILEQSEEVRRQYDAKNLELAKYDARSQAMLENYEQSKDQLERLKGSFSRRNEEKERIRVDLEQCRENEIKFKDEIQELIERREAFEEQLNKKKEEHAGILEEMQVVESRLKEAHKKQVEAQETKARRTIALERAKMEIQTIEEQTMEKYHLEIGSYEFERDHKFDIEKSTREISRLRGKMDGMGAINMMAIEEYERLTQRYNFITQQREEVIGSIRLLEEAIMEIEETAKEKFLATYHVINQNFADLFPILFPTGEAKLHLTNEEDPLNSGVDILVRLPGKKQASMTLFSGGEKALTAISLIFALLKTKPTPFCFLDEVDAPLDEANVGRYNKVLEALSDRFQFIVITHNRRTMEVLDQLYGVTMQEGGVSKVVGVDMKKDLPAHLQKAFKQEKTKERAVEGASAQG